MSLPSGADIQLLGTNTYDFMLDQPTQGHYRHRWVPRYADDSSIAGMVGKRQTRPNRIVWALDRWEGGTGARVWNPEEPEVYRLGNGNTRLPGQFTGRPSRALVTTLTANAIDKEPRMAIGDGALWYGGGQRVGFTTNGTTWTICNAGVMTGIDNLDATYYITAMTGDSEYVFYSAYHGGSIERVVLRKKADNSTNAEVVREDTGTPDAFAGMAICAGKLYCWTGRVLKEYRIGSGLMPLDADHRQTVYNTQQDVNTLKTLGTTWFADCVASENAVFMFHSVTGSSTVHMFLETESGREIWKAPSGFTIKSISYNAGVIFLAGNYMSSANNGWGCVYAIPVQTLQPIFLGWFTKHLGMKTKDLLTEGSYGNSVMFSDQQRGMVWIYDMDADGLSMLDYIATSGAIAGDLQPNLPTDALAFTVGTNKIGDMATFGDNRYCITYSSAGGAGNYTMVYWESDEEADRQKGTVTNDAKTVTESPRWDIGFPNDQKSLDKITVVFKVEDTSTNSGLKVGQSALIEIQGTNTAWQTVGTITSATVASGKLGSGRIVLSAGTEGKMFTDLKYRVTLTGGYNGGATPVAPPIVYTIAADIAINNYDEYFDLVLRVKDEGTVTGRSSRTSRDANMIRTRIKEAIFDRTPLTFKDGYLQPLAGVFDTYTVLIENAEDVVDRSGEGTMSLTLRVMEAAVDGGAF